MNKTQFGSLIRFLLQSIALGLSIAFVAVYFFPHLLSGEGLRDTDTKPYTSADVGPVSYRDAVARAAPSVVNVYATTLRKSKPHPLFQDPLFRRFFGQASPKTRRDNSLGSGVIIGEQGHILTNAHVVKGADEILITLTDGRLAFAEIIGMDEETDLAVLQINLNKLPLPEIGDSNRLRVGDVVLAIGNPYDFGQTVTQGIVSATGRKRLSISTFDEFIQTDADINPGNSGGALISARGDIIGINTAIISSSGGSQGIGLAIPIHLAVDVMRQLIENGHVVRGWLGVEAQQVPMDIADAAGLATGGVFIAAILQGGPADAAGIMPGDILLEINEKKLASPQQAIDLISQFKPQTKIDIKLLHGWEEKTLNAIIGQRPLFKK
jgi:serine protease DegS